MRRRDATRRDATRRDDDASKAATRSGLTTDDRALADDSDADGARRALRGENLSKLRADAVAVTRIASEDGLRASRNGLTLGDVTRALDAFDDALRAEGLGAKSASSDDVRRTADDLIRTLERLSGRSD